VRRAVGSTRAVMTSAPTATCVVKFEQSPGRAPRKKQPPLESRVPRVARLLGLAHRIERMIHEGELKDWADAARLVGVTRARMTQIANLLLLAPHIQELLLAGSSVVASDDRVSEHVLRSVVSDASWEQQERQWGRKAD
jgi:hypothetical protein